MDKPANDPIFKKGIWIKEQQGSLTMGSLDKKNKNTMVIPEELCKRILTFEDDMIDAMYGENCQTFTPGLIDTEKLLSKIQTLFKNNEIRISFSNPQQEEFRGDYDKIFNLLQRLVESSLSNAKKETRVYINASILQGHLCIIYRDSDSVSDPSRLKDEFHRIKEMLTAEISYKKTSETKAYYDIMIPSKT